MVKPCQVKRVKGKEYRCFFELALQVIGGKWKPIILYQLSIDGVLRFGELKRSVVGITERMLTRQLRELEKDHLVKRKVYHQVPPKVEYSLKPFGVTLIPLLLQMREWGREYEIMLNDGRSVTDEDKECHKTPPIASVYQKILNDERLSM